MRCNFGLQDGGFLLGRHVLEEFFRTRPARRSILDAEGIGRFEVRLEWRLVLLFTEKWPGQAANAASALASTFANEFAVHLNG